MGRLVANTSKIDEVSLYEKYEDLLLKALSIKATPRKHANVIQHIMGFFKKDIGSEEKQELLETIDQYKNGTIPLIVPITLLKHYVRKYRKDYLLKQVYLEPYPLELKLRNHV
jgi:uncharacterized protein YbgA (DUF1722 family)